MAAREELSFCGFAYKFYFFILVLGTAFPANGKFNEARHILYFLYIKF